MTTSSPDSWSLILAWLPWYALGIAVETPIYFVLGRYFLRRAATAAPVPRLLLASAAGTAVTHPLFVFVWPRLFDTYLAWAVSGEIVVTGIETLIFYAIARPIRLPAAAACSLAANGTSLLMSLAIQ